MEIFFKILQQPEAWLGFGLLIALYVMIKGWFLRRALEKQNASLIRGHLLMHDTGRNKLIEELETLKRQNENLRITLVTLKSKTGKTELRTLHIYDKAIRLMHLRAPGFGAIWESTLAEAEFEMQQVDNGILAWVKKTIRPSLDNKAQVDSQTVGKQSKSSVYTDAL